MAAVHPDTPTPSQGAPSSTLADLRARRTEIVSRWAEAQLDAERLARYDVRVSDGEGLVEGFVGPLFDLFVAWLASGRDDLAQVYLDERLRYAPFLAGADARVAFFGEVLPADRDAILEGRAAADREALASRWDALHGPLLAPPPADAVRVLLAGDCLLNEVRVFLPGACRAAGFDVESRILYFSAQQGRGLDPEGILLDLSAHPADLVAFSFFSYEGLAPYPALLRQADRLSAAEAMRRADGLVELAAGFLTRLREGTDVPFLVHDASGLPLTRWRMRMPWLAPLSRGRRRVVERIAAGVQELAQGVPNTLVLPELAVARDAGYRRAAEAVVPASVAEGALFHTARFGQMLAAPYAEVLQSRRDLKKVKVLLVDFDNTLWVGVMVDEEVVQHRDRQLLLRRLKEAGILLVAVSKNSPEQIRWNEMVLQPDDFVLQKISWNLKIQSIEETATQLDLGLDSFVLLDDSAEERGLVRMRLPQVRALDSLEASTWTSLERMFAFPETKDTEEARTRTDMYRAAAKRSSAMSGPTDYAAMMRELGLVAPIGEASKSDLGRLTELVQRTNQYNTTTIRHPRSDLAAFLASEAHGVYVAELSDQFGDFGIVIVVIVTRDGTRRVFDTFVMSCRAMGFGLETTALRHVLDAEGDGNTFVGRYAPTPRNSPCADLYARSGFREIAEGEWLLEPGDERPEAPDWIEVRPRGRGSRTRTAS